MNIFDKNRQLVIRVLIHFISFGFEVQIITLEEYEGLTATRPSTSKKDCSGDYQSCCNL